MIIPDERECINPFNEYPHAYFIHYPMKNSDMEQMCLGCYIKTQILKKRNDYTFGFTLGTVKKGGGKNITFINNETL